MTDDDRLYYPACARNRDAILEVLAEALPADGLVAEIGSGSGEHGAYFSSRLPGITWQPIDRGTTHASIVAWNEATPDANVLPPITFDLFDEADPIDSADALVCINTIHIAPWPATRRLFELAARILPAGGPVFLYGPFRYRSRPLEPSNERFDAMLRARDPESGIRCFEEVDAIASELGFEHVRDVSMPANNRSIWWRRLA